MGYLKIRQSSDILPNLVTLVAARNDQEAFFLI